MFVQTIYESKAHTLISEDVVNTIVTRSFPRNLKHSVTGFLYYDDMHFVQVVEGRPADVADTMCRIEADPLHYALKVRLMYRSETREFADWPLATVHADDYELRRLITNMGYTYLLEANIMDIQTILKRTSSRKYRIMQTLQKGMGSNVSSTKRSELAGRLDPHAPE